MTDRPTLSLDGLWTFSTDPSHQGTGDRWFERTGFEREVTVPGPWQLYDREMLSYTGHAWYHKAFELPADWAGQAIALRFDAVDYEARVWLNGQLLGSHEGGYTPFEFRVTDALQAGTNHLVMRVLDPRDNSEIPHGKQGSWYTRVSGPWQPVRLEARNPIHVLALRVTPLEAPGDFEALVEVAGPDGTPVALEIQLDGEQDPVVARVEGTVVGGVARLTGHVEAARWWSPESPTLYTAVARLGGDRFAVRFGFRWVSYRDGQLALNGQPLYIRGALDQAFYPETIYRAPSLEAIEHEIAQAKAMGLNLLRKHIKLEDPRYLDACDRLGMLVWEEPACFAKYTPQAKARFQGEIEAMIARDYNHPSIIIWSLYNEEWGLEWRLGRDAEKQEHVEALYNHAKGLDSTRLFCDNSGWAHVKTDINDWHRYFTAPDLIDECITDLAVCVEQPETNFVQGKQQNARGVPVIISEFGVWGLPEIARITDWYQGRPWWFDAQWAGHTEEFKYPATAERNFARFELERVFGRFDHLAAQCQRRMMRALKPIIEAMRRRSDLAGYVVTELTDIEWEANGWLDYFRQPKAGFEEFAWFNGPLVVGALLDRHNAWSDEAITGKIWVSNHTGESFDASVRTRLVEFAGFEASLPVHVPAYHSGWLPIEGHRFGLPDVEQPSRATLAIELLRDGQAVARNEEELTVMPRSAATPHWAFPVALVGGASALAPALKQQGAQVVGDLPGALVITTTLNAAVRGHLEAGGNVLFIAEAGEGSEEKGEVSFRRLPRGESWDRAASIFYVAPEVFGDLPTGGVMGWEMENLFPHHVVPLSNYLQDFGGRGIELPSNQAQVDPQGILAGYFEGWLGKFAAAILRLPYEHGTLTVTTLRLLEHHGSQPIGTVLFNRLAAIAMTPLAARSESRV